MLGLNPLLAAEETEERHAALTREAEEIRRILRSKRVNRLSPLWKGLLILLVSIT
jgi:hypothetical protein